MAGIVLILIRRKSAKAQNWEAVSDCQVAELEQSGQEPLHGFHIGPELNGRHLQRFAW